MCICDCMSDCKWKCSPKDIFWSLIRINLTIESYNRIKFQSWNIYWSVRHLSCFRQAKANLRLQSQQRYTAFQNYTVVIGYKHGDDVTQRHLLPNVRSVLQNYLNFGGKIFPNFNNYYLKQVYLGSLGVYLTVYRMRGKLFKAGRILKFT